MGARMSIGATGVSQVSFGFRTEPDAIGERHPGATPEVNGEIRRSQELK